MKARELMRGDWVYYTGDEEPKIKYVDELTALNQVYLLNGKLDPGSWLIVGEKYIKPIPLTPEILGKNGFRCTPAKGERVYAYDNYVVWVDFKDNKYWLNIKVSNDDKTENPVHYYEGYHSSLHELQHALLLCGIDKEITM